MAGIEQFKNFCICQDCGWIMKGGTWPDKASPGDPDYEHEPYCPECHNDRIVGATKEQVKLAGLLCSDCDGEGVKKEIKEMLKEYGPAGHLELFDKNLELKPEHNCPTCKGQGFLDIDGGVANEEAERQDDSINRYEDYDE